MNPNEDTLVQKELLPLPSAALVIDVRGIDDDDVVDRLRIEVEDLATELRSQGVHHWRYLTEFLSFTTIEPMSPEEVDTLRPSHQSRNGNTPAVPTSAANTARSEQKGLTGKIDPSSRRGYSPAVLEGDGSRLENRPFGVFQQNLDRMIQEADRIRNNHIVAVTDLDKAGTGGTKRQRRDRARHLPDRRGTACFALHRRILRSAPEGILRQARTCRSSATDKHDRTLYE